jgi:hypothetical protein
MGTAVKAKCRVAGCNVVVRAGGLCRQHYYRRQNYGDPLLGPPPRRRKSRAVPCTVPDCRNLTTATSGLCAGHAMRLRRKGTVEAEAPLRAPRGKATRLASQDLRFCVIESSVVNFFLRKVEEGSVPVAEYEKSYIESARRSLEADQLVPWSWLAVAFHDAGMLAGAHLKKEAD